MKQLIKLICSGALVNRETQEIQTTHHYKRSDWQNWSENELVWRGIDGTVIAREINLAP
jgi:hypothetical protein